MGIFNVYFPVCKIQEHVSQKGESMKNPLATLLFLSLVLSGTHLRAHTDVSPQDAKDMIDANADLIIVDVREEQGEYCDEDPLPPVPPGHIPGALNYPWASGVLEERYTELPPDGEILVVCRSGHRSHPAAEFLDSEGYLYVYDMSDGMSAWEWETVGCVDFDGDGFNDDLDNCPADYNPDQEDIDCDGIGDICDGLIDCTEGVDCDSECDGIYNQNDNCPNDYNPLQEDTYPPEGNGIGDACECEADFDCNGNVDAEDVTTFLEDFGRNQYNDPCENGNQCKGDFDCNSAVDATDVTKFLEDFGRNQYNNPCPACVEGDWCVY